MLPWLADSPAGTRHHNRRRLAAPIAGALRDSSHGECKDLDVQLVGKRKPFLNSVLNPTLAHAVRRCLHPVSRLVRLAGAVVLLWLGWGLARNWRLPGPANHAADDDRRGYFAGLASNVSNPKALLFFSAVIPQFLGSGTDVGARTGILAATVVFGAAAWWGLVISGIRLMPGLRSARAQSALALVGGLLLIGLSAGMLWAVVHEQLPG